MFHRESGSFKTTYQADMALFPLPINKVAIAGMAVVFFVIFPVLMDDYYLTLINLAAIAVVGALGLNILLGYTGQISIGHGAFMSVGAYTAANFAVHFDFPFWITIPAGGLMAAAVGLLFGLPSLRVKGLYLAIATLAAQFIIEWTLNHTPVISGGVQASIEMPRPVVFGNVITTPTEMYLFLLPIAALAIIATMNLVRSRIGRRAILKVQYLLSLEAQQRFDRFLKRCAPFS